MSARDDAQMHMVEAFVILGIMLSALTAVVTFEVSGPSVRAEPQYGIDARDGLEIPYDMARTPSACGEANGLGDAVVQALNGDFAGEIARMKRIVGEDMQINLALTNGHGSYPLYTEFSGPANAAAIKSWEPNTTWVMPIPQLTGVDGTQSLVLDTPALHQGRLVKAQGEAIRATVKLGSVGTAINSQTHEQTALTALLPSTTTRQFVQNMTWTDPDDMDIAAFVRAPVGLELSPVDQEPMEFRLWLSPPDIAGAKIPMNTEVVVVLPAGWNYTDVLETRWEDSPIGSDEGGWIVTFTLIEDASGPTPMRFRAKAPLGVTRPHDVIQAQLGYGSLGQAPFIVQYDVPLERGLPRTVLLTTPYPLLADSWSSFAVTFVNGGADTTVREVVLDVPGQYDLVMNDGQGAALFAEATPVALNGTSPDGTWARVDAKHLKWTGTRPVAEGEASTWIVSAKVNASIEATSVEGERSRGVLSELLLENGFEASSITLGPSMGVLRQTITPDAIGTTASDGYPWSVVTEPETRDFTATVRTSTMHAESEGTYTLLADASELVAVKSAATNSSFRVKDHLVHLGGGVRVESNLESLVNTLAKSGTSETTTRIDLYSPLSHGCTPTATWERESSTMPLAGFTSLDVYDETGLGNTPSVYLASEDKHVYRLDAAGALTWSQEVKAVPTAIDAGPTGVVTNAVFVGDATGFLRKLDLTLGTELWAVAIDAGSVGAPDNDVLSVILEESNSRVLVMTPTALEVRDASTGDLIARRATGGLETTYSQAEWATDGGVYALTNHALYKLTSGLAASTTYYQEESVGFTIAPSTIFLTDQGATIRLDPTTLTTNAPDIAHSLAVGLTASGDATNDATRDHLIALADLSVLVIDGATSAITTTNPPLAEASGVGVGLPTFEPIYACTDEYGAHFENPDGPEIGNCSTTSVNYQNGQACLSVGNPTNNAPTPLLLRADSGRILYAYAIGGIPRLYGWHHEGIAFVDEQLELGHTPRAMWLGDWNLLQRTNLVATSGGDVTLRDETSGLWLWVKSPTDFIGQFVFNLPIPHGGHYGTHIIVNTLSWTTPTGQDLEAKLFDWFHVTASDGTDPVVPVYTVHLSVRDPFHPPEG